MTFYYSDFPEVKFDYIKYNSNYEIDRQLFYDSIEEAKKDANRIYNLLVYKIKNGNKKDREKYKDITVVVGVSQTKGTGAQKLKQTTKGRPKHIINGEKRKPHLHILVYGTYASSFCNEILEKLNNHNDPRIFKELRKKFRYETDPQNKKLLLFKKELIKPDKQNEKDVGLYKIPYVWNQSEEFYMYGNFKSEFQKTYKFYGYRVCEIKDKGVGTFS